MPRLLLLWASAWDGGRKTERRGRAGRRAARCFVRGSDRPCPRLAHDLNLSPPRQLVGRRPFDPSDDPEK
jgi:hypothetical protein